MDDFEKSEMGEEILNEVAEPDEAAQKVNRVRVLLQQGEFGRAKEEAEAILAEEPENSDAYFFKTMVCFGCKNESELIKKAGNLERSSDFGAAMQHASPERRKELADMNIMAKFEVNRRISYIRKKIELLDMEERNISTEKIYITEKARVEETLSKLKKKKKELNFHSDKINELLLALFRKSKAAYWGCLLCFIVMGLMFCIKLTAGIVGETVVNGFAFYFNNLWPVVLSFAVIILYGINQRYQHRRAEDDSLNAKIFALEKEREDLHDSKYLDKLYSAYIEERKHRISECEDTIERFLELLGDAKKE